MLTQYFCIRWFVFIGTNEVSHQLYILNNYSIYFYNSILVTSLENTTRNTLPNSKDTLPNSKVKGRRKNDGWFENAKKQSPWILV
jgi:hypothetical protein